MICPIREIKKYRYEEFGEKATVLGVLYHEGINVSEGFAISFSEFSEYLEHNGIRTEKDSCIVDNREIRRQIAEGSLPDSTEEKLQACFRSVSHEGTESLVVRSSARTEDRSTSSMAGVFESFTGIRSYDEMVSSIKKCYVSCFSDKAVSFMLKAKADIDSMKMGVIVQKYVPGEYSGVVFTADTVTMNPDTIVISMAEGDCKDFVDGTVESTTVAVRKGDRSPAGDTHAGRLIEELRDLSLKIEEILGDHQDIEWSFANGRICIFQSRPITTFIEKKIRFTWTDPSYDDDAPWIHDGNNTLPVYPFQEDVLQRITRGTCRGMEATGKGKTYRTRIMNGYVFHQSDFSRNEEIRTDIEKKALDYGNEGLNVFHDTILPEILEYRSRLDALLGERIDANTVVETVETALEFIGKYPEYHFISVDGSMYINHLRRYCENNRFAVSGEDFFCLIYRKTLLTKEREILLSLAEFVKSNGELYDLFQSVEYDNVLYIKLAHTVTGDRLIRSIDTYLSQYGLMPVDAGTDPLKSTCSEIYHENKSRVLSKIRSVLKFDINDYRKSIDSIMSRKKYVIDTITARLDDEAEKGFMKKLRGAEKAFSSEDDHNYHLDIAAPGYLRLSLKRAGEYLFGKNLIGSVDDVKYFHIHELMAAVKNGTIEFDLDGRKSLFKERSVLSVPEVLGGTVEERIPAEITGTVDITGTAGSRGTATGKAVIINNAFEAIDISGPCILVIPHGHGKYIVPFLDKVNGILFDASSPFDHVGILAREFGIPTLYDTKTASKTIMNGDTVVLICSENRAVISRGGS